MTNNMLLIIVMLSTISCSRWIAPPYTNVDKLSNIQIGATLQQVNNELGIEPYDVYYKGKEDFIVIYNYRVKDRIMKVSNDYENTIHSDISQTNGSEWYGEKYFCYIYFKDKKVKSIITDLGKTKSEDILVKNNNIFLIQKDKIGFYEKNDTIIFVPMR